jgi:N-acetylglucosamine-6-phosphate deacetylase
MDSYAGIDPLTSELVSVTVDGDTVSAIESHRIDAPWEGRTWIAPGLVDLQVNGFAGFDFNADPPQVEQVIGAARSLLAEGITTFVPTLITASHEQVAARLAVIRQARDQDQLVRTMIPYVHLEGPHLSDQDGARGVHDPAWIRPPSLDEFLDWQRGSGDLVGMVTLSPHYDGSAGYIAALSALSIRVAIGHTHADEDQIGRAVAAGASLSTHLGNGAHPILPRHPNYIWSQLAEDRLTAGFIADGHHLPASTLKAMIRAKGMERSLLVSDAVALAGSPPGRYDTPVGGQVDLSPSGRLTHVGSGLLAGAARSLAYGVATVANGTDLGLAGALDLATAQPGRLARGRGRLSAGGPADLILFYWQPGEPRLTIETVVKAGLRHDHDPGPAGP